VKNERDIAQVAFDRALAETHPEARITQKKSRNSSMSCGRMFSPAKRHFGGLISGPWSIRSRLMIVGGQFRSRTNLAPETP